MHDLVAGSALPTQWRASEFSFTAAADYPDVFAPDGALLEAVFTGPGQETFTVPGFWDGERSWKVRFAPTVPGAWRYVTRFSHVGDTGLHEQRGTFEVTPAAGDNPLYRHGGFLRVAPTQRHLTYADGTPFFWLGDTWWFCPSELMPIDHSNRPGIDSMFKYLIDTRAAQGYSVIHMAFLGPSGVKSSYTDLFEGGWNADYWRQVDRYLQYAADKGLLPVIGLGFHQGLNQPSLEQLQRLWHYFLARYSAFPVTFLICGEYNLATGKTTTEIATDRERAAKVLALGEFIKDKDPYRRAMTVHPWWYGGDGRQAWDKPWLDFILIQGGHSKEGPPPAFYREVYSRGQPKPFIESECTYEGIHGFGAQTVRHNAYKAIQCGSFGFTYGAHGLWYPTQDENDSRFKEWGAPIPWWKAADFEGGKQMRHLRACYESVDWWTLEPRANAVPANPELLVKGCADRTFLVWYPVGGSTKAGDSLTGTRADGHYSAEWFDPRSGRRQSIGALTAAASGLALPAPPSQDDWMLILRGTD